MIIYLSSGSRIKIFQDDTEIGEATVTYIDEFKQEIGIKELVYQPENIASPEKHTIRLVLKNGWRELFEIDNEYYVNKKVPPLSFEPKD